VLDTVENLADKGLGSDDTGIGKVPGAIAETIRPAYPVFTLSLLLHNLLSPCAPIKVVKKLGFLRSAKKEVTQRNMQIKKLPTEALHCLPIVLDASTLKARWWTFTQGRIRKRTLFTT